MVSAVETTSVSSATISEAIEVRTRTQVLFDCGRAFTGLLPVVVDGSMAFLDYRPGEGPELIGGFGRAQRAVLTEYTGGR